MMMILGRGGEGGDDQCGEHISVVVHDSFLIVDMDISNEKREMEVDYSNETSFRQKGNLSASSGSFVSDLKFFGDEELNELPPDVLEDVNRRFEYELGRLKDFDSKGIMFSITYRQMVDEDKKRPSFVPDQQCKTCTTVSDFDPFSDTAYCCRKHENMKFKVDGIMMTQATQLFYNTKQNIISYLNNSVEHATKKMRRPPTFSGM